MSYIYDVYLQPHGLPYICRIHFDVTTSSQQISPHVTYVHTDDARDQLHSFAQHRYSCVEVAPEDTRTVLSEFSRAIYASPLDTTVSIALPHKHAHKSTWWPYLKQYKILKSELRTVIGNVNKTERFDTFVRRPGPRVLGSVYIDPVRAQNQAVLHAAHKRTPIYATVNIPFTSKCAALSLIDTGAAISVITKKLAAQLSLPTRTSHLASLTGAGSDNVGKAMMYIRTPLLSLRT